MLFASLGHKIFTGGLCGWLPLQDSRPINFRCGFLELSLHVCVFCMSILGETLCMDNIFVFVVQQAVQVKLFIQELHKTNMLDGVSYTYWDENYTSRV